MNWLLRKRNVKPYVSWAQRTENAAAMLRALGVNCTALPDLAFVEVSGIRFAVELIEEEFGAARVSRYAQSFSQWQGHTLQESE